MDSNSKNSLLKKKCIPCEGGIPPLSPKEFEVFLPSVPSWSVESDRKIEKIFKFETFKDALAFVNKVGEIAESENHHPDIFLFGWNKVKLSLMTHAVDGLTENDFIVAAKVDALGF